MEWADGKTRCCWANPQNPKYIQYHDAEWGVPVYDDRKLFEMLILECFQAGLSWECVLNKREAFLRAFDGFEPEKVSAYGEEKLAALQKDPGIIRNRLKIRAAVNNARIFRTIQQEHGSFSAYLWGWTGGKTLDEKGAAHSPLSDSIAKDLKKRGMTFVGTTIIYAYLQAVGVVYSHEAGCFLEHTAEEVPADAAVSASGEAAAQPSQNA
ncbi:MAG: DNA-3-methyladenine glycosylase I [Provencibacterium sp.]|jgi:DNA-3-methyladenine glycosylase I|nr:DNA-3-methyladenine glycosylase I [Provencibacterium sp.]